MTFKKIINLFVLSLTLFISLLAVYFFSQVSNAAYSQPEPLFSKSRCGSINEVSVFKCGFPLKSAEWKYEECYEKFCNDYKLINEDKAKGWVNIIFWFTLYLMPILGFWMFINLLYKKIRKGNGKSTKN